MPNSLEFFFDLCAIVGIGMLWFEFKRVLKMYNARTKLELNLMKNELKNALNCDGPDEGGYCSDDCGEEAHPQTSEQPFYIS